jgi:beta-lactamase class D
MKTRVTALLAFCLMTAARAEDPDIAAAFARAGLEGTFVVTSLGTGARYMHNDTRAGQRFPVASTFKILNSLIALETGVVKDKDTLFRWDGMSRDIPGWNRDQTLESAFKVSCVWCYQQMAARISPRTYQRYLKQADYGRLQTPFKQTEFWLDEALKVSALDQVSMLRKVYLRQLPFRDEAYNTLRQIMLAERTPSFSLYAKTGWAARSTPQTGWYTGYVTTAEDVWFFALNVDIGQASELPLRVSLAKEALRVKGVIPVDHD